MTTTMTDFHAKYFAHELTRRCSSDSVEKLSAVLADAQVDLNPHQVETALFANGLWFDTETDKLDRWAEDRRASIKADLP